MHMTHRGTQYVLVNRKNVCVQIEYANNSYLKSHSLSLLLVECPCHLADNYEPTQEKVKVEGMRGNTEDSNFQKLFVEIH